MSKLFESQTQWKAVKAVLLEGREISHSMDGTPNPNKRAMMDLMFENTRRTMLESASAGATASSNIATLNKVILPIIRRVMPTVIANEIIGVQPMSGPVGQITTLRTRYLNTVPALGGGVSAGAEALGPFDIARYYAGNGNVANPGPAPTSTFEGSAGNRLGIQMVRQMVEAQTMKLSAQWTFEAQQDANSMYGIDIEAEVMAALASEITAEIDQCILMSLRALPGTPTATFKMDDVTGTPTYVGDVHAALAILMNRQANLIASRLRRQQGNWAVISPTALTILQSAATSAFARTTEGTFTAPSNTKFVGVLNNSMRIYVDQLANDATPVMVGYKGNETDAAAFYCPYVPLTSPGTIIDPNTLEPVTALQTRYGYVELKDSSSSFGNAADYLGLIAIDTASLTFL